MSTSFGSYERCSTCGEYGWTRTHKCPPRFLVWCPEYGEEPEDGGRVIYAQDHEGAAERWAEQSDSDSADYDIVQGSTVTVHVVSADGDPAEALRFTVGGEYEPTYYARPLDE